MTLKAQDKKTYDIDGKQKTGYEVSQDMRRLETATREQKRIRDMARESGDKTLAKQCNERIKSYRAKYDEIAEKAGIKPDYKRMNVNKSDSIYNSIKMKQSELLATPPKEYDGVFDDFEELKINKTEKEALSKLLNNTKNSGFEYGVIIEDEKMGDLVTSKLPNSVKIPLENKGRGLTILHSHTNATPLSATDFQKFIDERVEKIGVIGYNNDVYMASVGYGERPPLEDFQNVVKTISREADMDIIQHPNFFEWSIEERNYIAIREQAFRIAQHYGWRIEGGRIDVK